MIICGQSLENLHLEDSGYELRRNDIYIYTLFLNSQNERIIRHLFNVTDAKFLHRIDTRLWILFIINMFDFEYTSIYHYQMNVLRNCLYKNRVHDLLDISLEENDNTLREYIAH